MAVAGEIFGSAKVKPSLSWTKDIVFPYILDTIGKEVQLSHGTYTRLMESKKREVRRLAYHKLYATFEQFQHTYAKTLQTNVKVQNYTMLKFVYKSALVMQPAANFLLESVYDKIVAAVRKHLRHSYRYLLSFVQKSWGFQISRCTMYTPLFHLLNTVLPTKKP